MKKKLLVESLANCYPFLKQPRLMQVAQKISGRATHLYQISLGHFSSRAISATDHGDHKVKSGAPGDKRDEYNFLCVL